MCFRRPCVSGLLITDERMSQWMYAYSLQSTEIRRGDDGHYIRQSLNRRGAHDAWPQVSCGLLSRPRPILASCRNYPAFHDYSRQPYIYRTASDCVLGRVCLCLCVHVINFVSTISHKLSDRSISAKFIAYTLLIRTILGMIDCWRRSISRWLTFSYFSFEMVVVARSGEWNWKESSHYRLTTFPN